MKMRLSHIAAIAIVVSGCEEGMDPDQNQDAVLDYCVAIYLPSNPNNACITNTPGFNVQRGATTNFTVEIVNKAGPPRSASVQAQPTVGKQFTCAISPANVNIPGTATLSITAANTPGPGFSDNCAFTVTSEGETRTFLIFVSTPSS